MPSNEKENSNQASERKPDSNAKAPGANKIENFFALGIFQLIERLFLIFVVPFSYTPLTSPT